MQKRKKHNAAPQGPPSRGTIVVDSNMLQEMAIGVPTELPVITGSPLETLKNPTHSYLDLLPVLAAHGYRIVIPETIMVEAGDMLKNGSDLRALDPDKPLRYPNEETVRAFFRHVLAGHYPNVEVSAAVIHKGEQNYRNYVRDLTHALEQPTPGLGNDERREKLKQAVRDVKDSQSQSKRDMGEHHCFDVISAEIGRQKIAHEHAPIFLLTADKRAREALREYRDERSQDEDPPVSVLTASGIYLGLAMDAAGAGEAKTNALNQVGLPATVGQHWDHIFSIHSKNDTRTPNTAAQENGYEDSPLRRYDTGEFPFQESARGIAASLMGTKAPSLTEDVPAVDIDKAKEENFRLRAVESGIEVESPDARRERLRLRAAARKAKETAAINPEDAAASVPEEQESQGPRRQYIPITNMDTSATRVPIVAVAAPKPVRIIPPPDPSKLDVLGAMQYVNALPDEQKSAYTRDSGALAEIKHKSAIYFVKQEGEVAPYLFIARKSRPNATEELRETVRDMFQSGLGLKDEQRKTIRVGKGGTSATADYFKVKIPGFTYRHDAVTGDPEISEGRPVKTEELSAAEVAKAIGQHFDIPVVNTPDKPVAELAVKVTARVQPQPAVVVTPLPKKDPHAPDIGKLPLLEAFREINALPADKRAEYTEDSPRMTEFKKGAIFYTTTPNETPQPYLYLKQEIADKLRLSEAEILETARDIFQAKLGLKDDQLAAITIEKLPPKEGKSGGKNRQSRLVAPPIPVFKIKIPEFTTRYDAAIGDPDPAAGRPIRTETVSAPEVANLLAEALAVPVINTQATPINNEITKWPERPKPPAPPAPPEPKPDPHAPDISRLSFVEQLAHVRSLPEKERLEYTEDSKRLQAIKTGSIYFLRECGEGVPYLFFSKSIKTNLRLNDDSSLAYQVGKLRESLASDAYSPDQRASAYEAIRSLVSDYKKPGNPLDDTAFIKTMKTKYAGQHNAYADFLADVKSKIEGNDHPFTKEKDHVDDITETVRDVFQATLGLKDHQLGTIKIEEGASGVTRNLYKVRIPEFSYHHDRATSDPDPLPGQPIKTHTLSSADVAAILSKELGIPMANSKERPTLENQVKLANRTDIGTRAFNHLF